MKEPAMWLKELRLTPSTSMFFRGSAVLLFVMMAVGVGAFIVIRNNRRQRKRGSDHDGVQWFPLGTNTSGGRRGVLSHEDELYVTDHGFYV